MIVNHLAKKILFVCSENTQRSPTAEDLLRGREGFEALSAGTGVYARRHISIDLIDWADFIFVMEEEHKEAIVTIKPEAESKITVLNIPDIYYRNDPILIQILKTRLSKHLQIDWNT